VLPAIQPKSGSGRRANHGWTRLDTDDDENGWSTGWVKAPGYGCRLSAENAKNAERKVLELFTTEERRTTEGNRMRTTKYTKYTKEGATYFRSFHVHFTPNASCVLMEANGAARQSRTVLSRLADANVLPSGEKATDCTAL
jgi:hypothetical protein